MSDNYTPQVHVPDMCKKHQSLLIHQLNIPEIGPWRSTILIAQIVLFQGVLGQQATHDRIKGDVMRVSELGCLACWRPDIFGEIVNAFQTGEAGAVKALGEFYCNRGIVGTPEPEEPER